MANISAIKLPDNTTYNIKAGAIPYGEVDSTSTSTAFTATVPGINELKNGTIMLLRNGAVTSASGFTININGLGAKPVYNNLATGNTHTPTNPTRDTTIFNVNYTMLFIYDEELVSGGAWICYRGYDANTNADWDATTGDAQILNKPTTISGYGITDAYTKTQIDGLVAGVLHYKGTKASVANLPTSGNVTGDVWHITADGSEYAWDGSVWQELGTAIDLSNYVTHGRTGSSTTGVTISDHSTTSIYGVSSSTTSVTGVQSSTTTASKVTVGSSTTDYGVKTTNTPTVIDTTKFNGGSYSHTGFSGGSFTRGNFSGGSLTMALDTTDTKKLKITFTAATHGNDSFTAASYGTDNFTAPSLGSGFYIAGTAATLGSKVPTVSASDVTVPIKATSATTVPIKNTSNTTVVTSGTHSITDPGHTHTI